MDWNQIILVGSGVALSIGGLAALVVKFSNKADKYLHVAKDAIVLADDINDALKDGKVDQVEIDRIMAAFADLKVAIKA